ncbi:MAG TPA: hypothetical protein VGM23_15015 [Armatimonadota bacterium]
MRAIRLRAMRVLAIRHLVAAGLIMLLGCLQLPSRAATTAADAHIVLPQYMSPTAKCQLVDWGFIRMHHPQLILEHLRLIQAGKLPATALDGAASPRALHTLLKGNWGSLKPPDRVTPTRQVTGPRGPAHHSTQTTPLVSSNVLEGIRIEDALGKSWGTLVGNVTPSPVNGPGHVQLMADYSPELLDFGSLAAGQSTVTPVDVIAPLDADVTFAIDQNPPPFYILFAESLTGVIVNGQPQTEQIKTAGKGVMHVHAGQTIRIFISFAAKSDTPVQTYHANLKLNAGLWSCSIPLVGAVSLIDKYSVLVLLKSFNYNILPGRHVDVPVAVSNVGGSNEDIPIEFSTTGMQEGVRMTPVTVTLKTGASQTVMLRIYFSGETPCGWTSTGYIVAKYKEKIRKLPVAFYLYQPAGYWSDSRALRDKVTWNSTVVMDYTGYWHWYAELHDDSTFTGDYWMACFRFNTPLDGKTLGRLAGGSLGPGNNHVIDEAGVSPLIAKHWADVVDYGINYLTYACTDYDFADAWLRKANIEPDTGL